jgi:Transposase, Mutator family/Glycosyl transferases group 1
MLIDMHKTANVLNKLPKSQQSKAKRALQKIWMAETKKDALVAFEAFVETWGVKYDKAVECLTKDRDALLAFYDFPAEHRKHLRTTNVIESSFATIRHRTVRSKGCLSNKTALAMIFKLAEAAEKSWRRLDGPNQFVSTHALVRMPPNAEIVHMKLGEARFLYAESAAVVIPLRANSMGAGTTTMVEAMLMGKPVIITRSHDGSFAGRRDLIDGDHVIMVDAGDVTAWRKAIERLMTDAELRRRIGAKGREWALHHTNREQWLEIFVEALRGSAGSPKSWTPPVTPWDGFFTKARL